MPEIQFKDYSSELPDGIAKDSLLNEYDDFVDAIDFDQAFEGVPANNFLPGTFGVSGTNEGLEYGLDRELGVSFLQSSNYVADTTGWRLSSDGTIEGETGKFRGQIVRVYTADGAITAGDVATLSTTAQEARTQSITGIDSVAFDSKLWSDLFTGSIFQIVEIDRANNLFAAIGRLTAGGVYVSIGYYSKGIIVWSALSTISATTADTPLAICKLSTSKFLVAWKESATSEVELNAVSIAAGVLTVGTTSTLTAFSGGGASLVPLATDKAHLSYLVATNQVNGAVITTSGTTITVNNNTAIESGLTDASGSQACLLGDHKVLVWYGTLTSVVGRLKAITISGTTQTIGTVQTLSTISTPTGDHTRGEMVQLATDKALLFGIDDSDLGSNGVAVIITTSGTTITLGTEVQIGAGAVTELGFGALLQASNRVLLKYIKDAVTFAEYITFSGSTITAGTDFNTAFNNLKFFPNYDLGGLTLNSDNYPFEFFVYEADKVLFLAFASSTSKALGVASETFADNIKGDIVQAGRITGLSGLTVGDEIRDRFDYSVIAVADTTTSLVVFN